MTTQANTTTAQIAQLPQLPMENLWALWDDLFDRRPGHHQRTESAQALGLRQGSQCLDGSGFIENGCFHSSNIIELLK